MGYPSYAGAPGAEPAEVQSIRSMLNIARILAIIFGILLLLGGLAYVGAVYAAWSVCTSVASNICYSLGAILVFPLVVVIWGIVDIVIYVEIKSIEGLVNQRQYEAAKSKTLVWTIIGFILGGLITGILLLIAYFKFDPVINWARGQGGMASPMGGQMAPSPGPVPGGAMSAAGGQKFCASCGSPNAAGAQFCAKCGAPMPP